MTTQGRAEPVEWSADAGQAVIQSRAAGRGPLLPVLHALQETFGYIDPQTVSLIAKALNLSRADVHGVLTFYSDFRTTPPGRTQVQVCRAEACQAMGGRDLADHVRRRLGIGFGETSHAGGFSLDQVFCLGNCALAPAVTIDGRLVGRVTPARFDGLLGQLAPERSSS